MSPLDKTSGNARVTRSGARTQKGPAALQEQPDLASSQFKKTSFPHKRKIPVDLESEKDYIEDVGDEEMGEDSDISDFEPSSDDEGGGRTGADSDYESEVVEDKSTALPFDNAVGPSEHQPSLGCLNQYKALFKATVAELKHTSADLYKECGGFEGLSVAQHIKMNRGWVDKFQKFDPEVVTKCTLEDVPVKTMSILGDPSLNVDNCVPRFRNLLKVSRPPTDFLAGEYIEIVDRMWHTPTSQYAAGEIETKLYKGPTHAKIPGVRVTGLCMVKENPRRSNGALG